MPSVMEKLFALGILTGTHVRGDRRYSPAVRVVHLLDPSSRLLALRSQRPRKLRTVRPRGTLLEGCPWKAWLQAVQWFVQQR